MHSWPAVIVCLSPPLQHAHMHKLKQSQRKRTKVLSHSKKKDLFWLLFIWCPAGLGPKGWQRFTVPKLCFCHYQDRKTKQENRPPSFPSSSIPHWRFPHSLSITETFAEITLETLASCCFDPIRDILVYFFFFAISYQSTKQPCDLPLFKQLTSLAAKEPTGAGHANSSSIFEREKHHCVLHNFTQTSLPIQHMPVRPSVQHVLSGSCHISIYINI